MILLAAASLAAAAQLGGPRRSRRRLSSRPRPPRQHTLTPRAAASGLVVTGLVLFVAVGPAAVLLVGALLAVSLGLRFAAGRRRCAGAATSGYDPALALDVHAAAMASGALPSTALLAVARALPGPASARLAQAATGLALGVEPRRVWAELAAAVPTLTAAAQACARASTSGAAVADELFRLAAAARTDRQVRQRRQLQRAGVWLVLPLGLCFLPAFVLLAVVPVVLAAVPTLLR